MIVGKRARRRQEQPASPSDESITVALIPKVAMELQNLQERSGLSRTDLVNRAISLYDFIDAQVRDGREVLIRDPAHNETLRVMLL